LRDFSDLATSRKEGESCSFTSSCSCSISFSSSCWFSAFSSGSYPPFEDCYFSDFFVSDIGFLEDLSPYFSLLAWEA